MAMMKRYNRYRQSGDAWLREVPEHWKVSKLKYLADANPSNVDKKSVEGERTVLLCNYVDVYKNEYIASGLDFMSATASRQQIEKFELKAGDVMLTKDSEDPCDIAVPAVVKEDLPGVVCGYHLTHIRPNSEILNGLYLFRLFQSYTFNQQFTTKANGVTRFGLPAAAISDAAVACPPLNEQRAIVSYLDEKTALIDETIRRKQRLIELLQEERTALINQAVTRGLDPDVPMKPSGVEWLGEIPAHWELKKLKHIAEIRYGLGQPPRYKEDGLPLIRATNVYRGTIDENNLVYVDPDDVPWDRNPQLKCGDIVVVRSGAYTADSAIIPAKFEGAITGYDMVVSVREGQSDFVAFTFLSDYVLLAQLYQHRLRAAQPHLNREELAETLIACPPADEQTRIAKHLTQGRSAISRVVEKVGTEIELLQEYRTALINEVVTGKRCVVVLPEPALT